MKADWLAASIALHKEWLALYWSFSSGVGVKFAQSSSQKRMQGPIPVPEEMSQTLQTNKKQGNLDKHY
jgi:hypothetical protein